MKALATFILRYRVPLAGVLFLALFWCSDRWDLRDMNLIDPQNRLRLPGADYLLGSDALGRDLLARCLHGGQVWLRIGLSVALLTTTIGAAIGLLMGCSVWLEALVLRITDGLMAIPAMLLAIAIGSLNTPSVITVIAAITVPEIPPIIRLVRALALVAQRQTYVEASAALGSSWFATLRRHILPNMFAPLIVQGSAVAAGAIMVEAAMSFLGIGLPPGEPTWGNMIADARNYFESAPHLIYVPGGFLVISILLLNYLGDWLRVRIDPKMRELA